MPDSEGLNQLSWRVERLSRSLKKRALKSDSLARTTRVDLFTILDEYAHNKAPYARRLSNECPTYWIRPGEDTRTHLFIVQIARPEDRVPSR